MNGWNRLFIVFSIITFVAVFLSKHEDSPVLGNILFKEKWDNVMVSDYWVLGARDGLKDDEVDLIMTRAGFTDGEEKPPHNQPVRNNLVTIPGGPQIEHFWVIRNEQDYQLVRETCRKYLKERLLIKVSTEWAIINILVYLSGLVVAWVIRGFRS